MIAKSTFSPRGNVISTLVGCFFASNERTAATQQAVAQLPVVQPLRNGCSVSLDSGHILFIHQPFLLVLLFA